MFSIIFIILFILANSIFIFTDKPKDLSEYTLESRNLNSFKLFSTFLATNLSAFTIFGVSGAAYRLGWAFFPVMAFGTGFMAFSFVLFGIPLRKLAFDNNWITPSDFISSRFKSPILGKLISILLLIFTLPYISIQIGSLGGLLSSIANLPKWICSLIFTIVIAGYVLKGGMKSIVKTDILQLFVLYAFAIISVLLIFSVFKNDEKVKAIFSNISEIHRIDGKGGGLPFISLLGYYILWLMADPVFPHLTQRFYSAKSDKSLIKSMVLYPISCLIIFFAMSAIGIIGSVVFPNLPLNKTDSIFTLVLQKISGLYAPIFSLAAIAAIMSTLDSQLLTCSSMIANDFLSKFTLNNNFKSSYGKDRLKEKDELYNQKILRNTKIFVLLISILSYIISLLPISSMLSFLTNSAFNGYASLFIIYFCAIYFPKIDKFSAILTIFSGFILIILQNLKIIKVKFPYIFIIICVQLIILIISELFIKNIKKTFYYKNNSNSISLIDSKNIQSIENKIVNKYLSLKNILIILFVFILGLNIPFYFITTKLLLGLPLWLWVNIFSIIILSIIFKFLFDNK